MSENSRQSESHIDSIVRQEEEALERRSSSERLADRVGVFAGSLPFIALHLVFLIGWLLVNSGKIPRARPFDPYPFSLLGVIVAVETVILSSFILMRQNRMMRRGERRDHLNLQVDLLAEKEITKVLQMLRAICGHMGLQNIMADTEIRELSQNTSIESLSQTLEDRLPGTLRKRDYLASAVYCESRFRPAEIIYEFDCSHGQECVRDRVEYFHALDYLSGGGPEYRSPW